jgi:hypothetical protein
MSKRTITCTTPASVAGSLPAWAIGRDGDPLEVAEAETLRLYLGVQHAGQCQLSGKPLATALTETGLSHGRLFRAGRTLMLAGVASFTPTSGGIFLRLNNEGEVRK